MGSNASKYTKKGASSPNSSEEYHQDHTACMVKSPSNIIVFSRKGSMYIDEDGDLAHEFYVEVPPQKKGCKATMKRIWHNLIPQGDVPYKFPRLHVDFPVILHHV